MTLMWLHYDNDNDKMYLHIFVVLCRETIEPYGKMISGEAVFVISNHLYRDCPRQRYWDILPYFSKKSHCYFEMTNFYHWNLIRICAILELVWNSPIVLQVQAYPCLYIIDVRKWPIVFWNVYVIFPFLLLWMTELWDLRIFRYPLTSNKPIPILVSIDLLWNFNSRMSVLFSLW